MRDVLKGILAGVFVLALAGAIGARLGWIAAAPPRLDGTGAWMLARATGLVAYLALGLDVLAGLLVSTRRADRALGRGALIELHGWLSPIALALVAAHAGVLLGDRYLRFDLIDVVVPFASSRWPIALGLGGLAGYLALVVHASFGWRKRLGAATWRRLHYLSFAAFALATGHALAAGTDTWRGWFVAIYGALLLAIGGLLALRLQGASARPRT